MPTIKPVLPTDIKDKPQTSEGPIIQLDKEAIAIELEALHMIKVLKRVKELAPELWGIFRVKA